MEPTVKRLYGYLSSRLGNLPPGVSETDLLAFESRHRVQLPTDLRSCFLLFNGTDDQWADDWMIAFRPLERVKPVTEQHFPDAGSYFVVADHCVDCFDYVIRLSES